MAVETITKSFNIFIDSGLGDNTENNTGIDYQLNFNDIGIECPKDGFFRLSVLDFNMIKTFTNINHHNSLFILALEDGGITSYYDLNIPHKNYAILYDLAVEFYNTIATQIMAYVNAQTANTLDNFELSNVNPINSAGVAGTSNNVLSGKMVFKKGATIVDITGFVTSCKIQTYIKTPRTDKYTTAYQILGSKLIQDVTDVTSSSMTTTLDLANGAITITAFYPGCRFNEPYIYLRCSLPSDNLATSALDYFTLQTGDKTDLNHSNILARFPIQSEVVDYRANSLDEFMIDVHQNHLTNVNFYLTMCHGHSIPEFNTSQIVLGNLSFSMTLRCDIIRRIQNNEVNFSPTPINYPKKLGNVPTAVNSNRRI